MSFLLVITSVLAACDTGSGPPSSRPETGTRPHYRLQSTDEISISSLVAKELTDKRFRLDETGRISVPLVGTVKLEGMTVDDAQALITTRLKRYYVAPDVQVSVVAARTHPVMVLGSVAQPGAHQIREPIRLIDGLSMAGGLRNDAGPKVVITREKSNGTIAHSKAQVDGASNSVLSLDLTALFEGASPEDNIQLMPRDIVNVPAAQVVYVIGNVRRAGGFALNGRPNLSVVQALALAEGIDPRASPSRARILRRDLQGEKQISVNLKAIFAGKSDDVILRPNDVLFVPSSTTKVITTRSIETALSLTTGLIIWR
ncbi:MAG: polysaccharide biosynthesis/export family protein [Bryobacterales bacterium]|nr:polysaccharide biosynthesis/export family protein [Bryobacterales bacterium]